MTSKAQRSVILGLEAVPGDAATPDVALRATASLRAVVDKIIPDEDIGSFAPSRHYIAAKHGEGNLEMDGYYEHAPYPISMALGAGSVSGVSDPYTWTWTLPDGTAPTFATYRLEYGDGDDHIVSVNDVFATSLEISGEAGKAVMIKADLTGGSVTFPAALGASLTVPATVTPILMGETKLYMDTAFESIGGTEVAALISFNWKLENLQHAKQFAGALYPTGRGNDRWEITLELIVEIGNATIETMKDKLLTTDLAAIRVESSASANDSLTLDGMYALMELDSLDDRDGNNIIKMTYRAMKDSSGNLPSVVCVTNLAAL
jgi:hypothetical protein